ncbi:hypothetical protein E2F46_00410 [Luteimonas aestuarii]|uniref:Outer membrane protein beta-barrel domain-containing protein n=1 Tax=Luteimonas aestuarii TaxID=453837 RepID=A0A4R5U467_9GAMM|nr:hypothetical protein [Luteimonas aestuarii]TDK28393.1 hypothetical protein E2F46_00410 [Luteimonas aestuarii]
MNRLLSAALIVACLSPAAAMAQDGPSFSLFGGREADVKGDVHKGAIAPIADLGPLNPALAGVAAELRIESRGYDDIYSEANVFGVEMAWPTQGGEIFGQLASTRSSEGEVQVGGAFVPALDATLPVFGRFGRYEALALEGGYRHYFSDGNARPYLAGRLGATRVGSIDATFTIPAADITLSNVPFYESGWILGGGADFGVIWQLSEAASLGAEIGVRYHGKLKDDDSAIGGLGLASINDTGARTSFPVSMRLEFRF